VEEGSLGGSANHFHFGLAAISSAPPFCFLMQVPKFPLKPWRFGCYVKSSFVAPCFEGCSDVNRGDAPSALNCLSPVSLRHPRVIFLSLSIAVYSSECACSGRLSNRTVVGVVICLDNQYCVIKNQEVVGNSAILEG
jgi:hypothetical protein